MNVSQIIVLGAVVLAGFATSGCSKNPGAPPATADASPANTNAPSGETNAAPESSTAPAVPSRTTDLGVLQLTNHCETRIQLAGGKSCAITPHLIDHNTLQLTMVLESKTAGGNTQGLNITKVTTKIDQQFEVSFGGMDLTLTPQMAPEEMIGK